MSGYSQLRLITAADDAGTFDSGVDTLDDYLRRRALANQVGDVARCYVITHGGRVVGYRTLSNGSALRGEMPKALPTMVIGRMAVDLKHRRQGLGLELVRHAIQRTVEAADIAGVKFLIVHTQTTEAFTWWRHVGFDPMPANEQHLMLTVRDARANLDFARA